MPIQNTSENSNSKKDFVKKNEKYEKALVIEGMLAQLGMSPQDLVDLLNSILFHEKSESITISEDQMFVTDLNVDISAEIPKNGESLDNNTKAKEIYRSKDLKNHLSEIFSLEQLDKFIENINLVKNLDKLKKLGLKPDLAKISSMLNLGGVTDLNKNGSINSSGKNLQLSLPQLRQLNQILDKQINKFQEKQNTSSSFLGKTFNAIGEAFKKTTGKLKDTIHMLDYQADMIRLKQDVNRIESASRSLKDIESKIKTILPDITRISYSGKSLMVNLKGLDGATNLEKYLTQHNLLTPDLKKLIDQAGSSSNQLMKILGEFKDKYGLSNDTLSFSKQARLHIAVELEGTKKQVHVIDYLKDVSKYISSQKIEQDDFHQEGREISFEREDFEISGKDQHIERDLDKKPMQKSNEVKTDLQKLDAAKDNSERLKRQAAKNNNDEKYGNSERAKDIDLYDPVEKEEKKEIAEPEQGIKVISESGAVSTDSKGDKSKSEALKARDVNIKQDIIADKAKLIQGMKEAQGLMKAGLKDMDKAMQNKDLMKEMEKQMQKQKELNK